MLALHITENSLSSERHPGLSGTAIHSPLGEGLNVRPRQAFTIIELLVAVGIIIILSAIAIPIATKAKRIAKRTESLNNMKTFVTADMLYYNEHRRFPEVEGLIPSSITRNRLEIVANYCNLSLPQGPVNKWPRRKEQPRWINCPITRDSGYAEGMTLGGGVYTGYIYVGGIEASAMVKSGFATLTNPEHNVDPRGFRRGVIWASILGEFKTSEARRYECFHYNTFKAYPDFRFQRDEIEGIHRGWSDGSVEWLPASRIDFTGNQGSNLQIRNGIGNYYY